MIVHQHYHCLFHYDTPVGSDRVGESEPSGLSAHSQTSSAVARLEADDRSEGRMSDHRDKYEMFQLPILWPGTPSLLLRNVFLGVRVFCLHRPLDALVPLCSTGSAQLQFPSDASVCRTNGTEGSATASTGEWVR